MTDSPLTRVLTAHWLAGIDCDEERGGQESLGMDRARCACSLVDFGWQPSVGAAAQTWIAHVVALVAAETQAELARQFTGSGSVTATNGEYRVYNAGQSPALLPGPEAR